MLDRLGTAYAALGEAHHAQVAWRQAIDILDTLGHPDAEDLKKRRNE